jgi:exonuclease VII small subunit
MDKHKVIEAYKYGLLTIEECAQILGTNRSQLIEIMEERSETYFVSNPYVHLQTEQA